MKPVQEKCAAGACLHAGIPVVEYQLTVPQLADPGRGAARINAYYERLLTAETAYARAELTALAGADFEHCMEHSRVFTPFRLTRSHTVEADAAGELLTVRSTLTADFGRRGDYVQNTQDLWTLRDGRPVKKIPAAPK